jgi:hypothetical protein
MVPSCLSSQTFATALVAACRTVGLLACVMVVAGGTLGFAVSVHMAQVFDRVTTVRAVGLQPGLALHLALAGDIR